MVLSLVLGARKYASLCIFTFFLAAHVKCVHDGGDRSNEKPSLGGPTQLQYIHSITIDALGVTWCKVWYASVTKNGQQPLIESSVVLGVTAQHCHDVLSVNQAALRPVLLIPQ